MAMTPYSQSPLVISILGTTPQERGLETQQFKAKFDEGLKEFTEWFNATHKTEFELVQTDLATHLADSVTDADGAHGLKVESGVFTPAIKFGDADTGITYQSQKGAYVKIGNLVHFEMLIRLTNKGTATGTATITGLPFVQSDASSSTASVGRMEYVVMPAGTVLVGLTIGGATGTLVASITNAIRTLFTEVQFTNASTIYVEGTYKI